jgi:transposase
MMLLSRALRLYVATEPMNLRKSFDGLCNEVRESLGADPLSGHVFIFLNRRKNQVKLLWWTRGGFAILHKRLERGTFSPKVQSTAKCVPIDVHELSLMLEGILVKHAQRSARWEPPQSAWST